LAPSAPSQPITAEVVIHAILAYPHVYESADGFAIRIGLRNRHQLNRAIRHVGLPSYRMLAAFTRVLALRDQADARHRSLCAETIDAGFDPAWAYRTVKRVTGRRWSDIRTCSHDELVVMALRQACQDERRGRTADRRKRKR
jgi:hypothetical protein